MSIKILMPDGLTLLKSERPIGPVKSCKAERKKVETKLVWSHPLRLCRVANSDTCIPKEPFVRENLAACSIQKPEHIPCIHYNTGSPNFRVPAGLQPSTFMGARTWVLVVLAIGLQLLAIPAFVNSERITSKPLQFFILLASFDLLKQWKAATRGLNCLYFHLLIWCFNECNKPDVSISDFQCVRFPMGDNNSAKLSETILSLLV